MNMRVQLQNDQSAEIFSDQLLVIGKGKLPVDSISEQLIALTALFVLVIVLVYAAFEPITNDTDRNSTRGVIAALGVFIALGVTIMPDGPFRWPHPALWRLFFCLSILYELSLIFALFQSPNDARKLLKHFDKNLGKELDEISYDGSCLIYDPSIPDDLWHNVRNKLDVFVPTHFFGWLLKTLVLRDWWLCTVISVMFEILEYTLEHQLPNFSECWWDHWIMDVLVCNGLGIVCGLYTLEYFSMKKYHWRGLWNIPTYRGKLKRIFAQLGPYDFIKFEWRPLSSLGRWGATLTIVFVFLLTELNTFYLKFFLWIPPDHWLNLARLLVMLFWGAVALREVFQYLDDPGCKSFGRQSWTLLTIVFTEFLIVIRFGGETISKPIPRFIALFWVLGLIALLCYTVWAFILNRKATPKETELEVEEERYRWLQDSKCLKGFSEFWLSRFANGLYNDFTEAVKN
ncbi:phosphatidylserine synthase 2-like [Artemia franciscana]|uniref:phosphatidylserine synthase 2-like n=1 Tax=Artemia franciscana TaxID=6661 RepID=UPI0032DBA7D0